MKIVGRTDNGYIAQVSETELGIIMGYGRYAEYGKRKDEFKNNLNKDCNGTIKTNTEIRVVSGLDYLQTIREKIKTAQKTAKELRELADMLDNPIPTTIAPVEDNTDG